VHIRGRYARDWLRHGAQAASIWRCSAVGTLLPNIAD
jgi:hypothetical protein